MRVLVVDAHPDVADLVSAALAKDGHVVTRAQRIAEAEEHVHSTECGTIVVDLALPDGNAIEWCRRLRRNGVLAPVLLLGGDSAVPTRVAGLDAGADDFITKPFAVAELRARVRALGRRGPLVPTKHLTIGQAHLDFSSRRARVDDREVLLTSREWAIIELLAFRGGRVVTRHEILESLWGEQTEAVAASLEVLVGRLRRKLGSEAIRTVRGAGYASG